MWKEKVENKKPGTLGDGIKSCSIFEHGRTASNDADRRVYLRYKQNAERIIANVERGYFQVNIENRG